MFSIAEVAGRLSWSGRRPFLVATLVALFFWFFLGGAVARADDRFGPPWQSEVAVEHSVVYGQPDRASQPIGPLGKGAIVVVLGEVKGTDGSDWTQILDGYIPTQDLRELRTPWTAEVSAPSASIYAKPFAASGVRRTARQGDLLRVTGVSPGLEGDTDIWWATTDGFLRMHTLQAATNPAAEEWQLPQPSEAPGGWWGVVRSAANVRVGAGTDAPTVGSFAGGERVKVLAEEEGQNVQGSATWYRIDGGRYAGARIHSSLVRRIADPKPTVVAPARGSEADSWVVVNRSASTLTFVRNGQPEFVTYVALGKAGVATPTGTYSTFGKFKADDMSSATVKDPTGPYDLPNVPFTQYYLDGGYAIHGTYWHDGFGTPESQGCVNLTWNDGAYLFGLTRPEVPADANERWQTSGNPATPVVILD